MRKLLRGVVALFLVLLPLLGGAVAGEWLQARRADAAAPDPAQERPDADALQPAEATADAAAAPARAAPSAPPPRGEAVSYMKFPDQFFVPVVRGGTLESVMILSVALEHPAARSETLFAAESRLRDALLRELLIHANSGGFDGNFTAEARMALLRERLERAAGGASDGLVSAVLIGDIARQAQ